MIGLYTASNSGMSVQNQARAVVTQLVTTSLSRTAQYVAETMTKKVGCVGWLVGWLATCLPSTISYEFLFFGDHLSSTPLVALAVSLQKSRGTDL